MVLILPALLIITGMVLGFRAINDIRESGGRLGGAMTAVFAAGLLPAVFICFLCGGGLVMLAEEISPRARASEDVIATLGTGIGIWLSFRMMRGMHRSATGWVAPPARPVAEQSRLAAGAIILTVTGSALLLVLVLTPAQSRFLGPDDKRLIVLIDFAILLAGLICGVLARRETAGRMCAWISGVLFVLALLMAT